MSENVTIIQVNNKSPITAAILAFLFGPLGALYAGVSTALISFVCFAFAVGVGLLIAGVGTFITMPLFFFGNTLFCFLSVKRQVKDQ